jgi:hypothetical protein
MMAHTSKRKPDRDLLLDIVAALTVSKANLRRDPCGDWSIFGRRGHVSSDGASAYVYLRPGTKRTWDKAKRALGFLTVIQDGDDEGVLKMGDLPTAEQAEIIRKALGLRKVAPLTDKQRDTLNRFSFARDKTLVSEQIIDVPEVHPTDPASSAGRCRPQPAAAGSENR